MTETKPRRASPEKIVQGRIVRRLRELGFFVSTFSQAQRAQQTAGIPDVFACHARFGQVWIEVKDPARRNHARGGLSLDQFCWHTVARRNGVEVIVAYGLDEITEYLQSKGVLK